MRTIAVLGTFDTKGHEHAYLAGRIRAEGCATLLVDVSCLGTPQIKPDIEAGEVAKAAGPGWAMIQAKRDRGQSVAWMAQAAAGFVTTLAKENRIDGIISLGGGGGTAIATAAMRALPLGFPKVMVSTLASGNTAPYLGTSDLVMFPAVVDVAGLNRVSRLILQNAAGAICGMVRAAENRDRAEDAGKPVVVASMFGNTTACVDEARKIVAAAGFEVLVFHANGTGGRTMEALIASGLVAGVLDLTTTEWADELVGGILGAGPDRLGAAAAKGVPAVVVPGCMDMVNFGEPATVPAKFAGRTFYQHTPQVTLMRTSAEESAELGRILARKINASRGPVGVLWPSRGLSVVGTAGQPFHDPAADAALLAALKTGLRPGITLEEHDLAINDPAFARACAEMLLGLIAGTPARPAGK